MCLVILILIPCVVFTMFALFNEIVFLNLNCTHMSVVKNNIQDYIPPPFSLQFVVFIMQSISLSLSV